MVKDDLLEPLNCMDELNLPDLDLDFTDLPSIDEVLALLDSTPAFKPSPVPTVNQTPYTEKISIRIPHGVLIALKEDAHGRGMPYQTFINLILGAYANGHWRL